MNTELTRWRFFRAGGFDQVRLDSAPELLAIGELDQKLWVALSCPTTGIEFDARTLSFVDSDSDGHVRAPELIAAVQWAKERLKDSSVLTQKLAGVPLAAIRDDDDEGKAIAAAAALLIGSDAGDPARLITVEEASAAQASHAAVALAQWEASGAAAKPLGEATQAAYAAVQAVTDKVEDFFVRARLAAFDSRAGDALNAAEETFKAMTSGPLQAEAEVIAAMPLAHISANAALPLTSGLNPAWAARLETLREAAVVPLLGALESLSQTDWQVLKDKLAPYGAWLSAKPDPGAEGAGVRELEKLARYVRDLLALANNFVAFKDFYTHQGKAIFQIGTLYLDGRSCELVVAVNDAGKHAALASLSRLCLVYCDCVRGADKMSIAAAFTAGDADQLMVGRNGVFYDRQGKDWDATIVKIVDHPISLRQAFWAPYKRLARLVNEQLQKIAASKAASAESQLTQVTLDGGKKLAAPANSKAPAPPPTPFDVGKFAGIFAAIGLAVGALGTALASVLAGLLTLKWWQIPLALAGLMLVVSGPAVVLAWLKLRSRNLGPILDANGWAINARARINIPFGTSLTDLAQLPGNAERTLADPYAEPPPPWTLYGLLALLGGAALWWFLK